MRIKGNNLRNCSSIGAAGRYYANWDLIYANLYMRNPQSVYLCQTDNCTLLYKIV